jgi:hypothetical protein
MKTRLPIPRSLSALITSLLLAVVASAVLAAEPVIVATPAHPGPVTGTTPKQNSDEFIWRLFIQFVAPVSKTAPSPVVFETWASDSDTFSFTPHWPDPTEPKKLQTSVLLRAAHAGNAGPLDVPCTSPGNATVGGFPSTGTPTPCIAEEVRRNRPQYDYIINNNLNTQPGLAAAFAKSFKVTMPTTAIAIKGDWIPVQTLLQWVPKIGSLDNLRKLYYTGASGGVEYALVSLHVSSRQNTDWVWATFEHMMSPGRCDDIGCSDTFGATKAAVPPNKKEINTQYGPCQKSPALKALMKGANLSPVWENYCLKGSMVDYAAPDGTPYLLGNSVVERINANVSVFASSCIACHVYASFGANGKTGGAALNMLGYNPTGKPIRAAFKDSQQFDFMWGVLAAPAASPSSSPAPSASPSP